MKFGLNMHVVFHVQRLNEDIHLVDGSTIKPLNAEGFYTFLKVKSRKYLLLSRLSRRRHLAELWYIWRSFLSRKNETAANNRLSITLLSYTFAVIKWHVNYLQDLDNESRKKWI